MVKSFLKSFIIVLLLIIFASFSARGQTIKLLGGNVVNGVITGLALGGATMALQNSGGLGPLKFGLGAGIIYGIGIGIYDISIVPKGQRFYTSATFNSGHNHTIIVLLDTIYGAAAGAVIGIAASLLSSSPILDGLQYGAGAGTWIGFGFGLVDSFVLAKGPRKLRTSAIHSDNAEAQGMIKFAVDTKKVVFGFINPALFSQKVLKKNYLKTEYSFGVEVFNVNIQL
jgi:hypothetical protein